MASPGSPVSGHNEDQTLQEKREEECDYYLEEISEAQQANLKVIEWEDYQKQLGSLWSMVTTLNNAKAKKEALQSNLDSILQVRRQYLARENELQMLRHDFELQKRRLGNGLQLVDEVSKQVEMKQEKLRPAIHDLLVAANCLCEAHTKLLEAKKLFTGEVGNVQLRQLQKMLATRQQLMVAQAANLYPVDRCSSKRPSPEGSGLGMPYGDSSDAAVESLTIAGLQLVAPPVKKTGFFNDKQLIQSSAAAYGYVAHIVKLVASYLDIPLRYPIRVGGSRSYIQDHAPSVEPSLLHLETFRTGITRKQVVEFPLFLEGQDQTRSAFAVYLLNKDLDQLLSYVGDRSYGPRHTLPNLRRLIKTILSEDFVSCKIASLQSSEGL